MRIFEQTYSGESLVDAPRDIDEAFQEAFTPALKKIPTDEYGFWQGSFKVTIEWIPEEN